MDSNNDKYKILFETTSEGVVVVDTRGTITLANERLASMFGYDKEELIGFSVDTLVPGEFRTKHKDHRAKYAIQNASRSMGKGLDIMAIKKNGDTFHVEIGLNTVTYDGGTSVIAVVSDITERKHIDNLLKKTFHELEVVNQIVINKNNQLSKEIEERIKAEKALLESEKNLRESNSTKDKFFSIIAHDLKNPLGSFRDVTNLLSESFDSVSQEEQIEFIKLMNESSKQLYSLLENLLQWSRSQTGRMDFLPEKTNLSMIADNNIGLLKMHADNKKITLENAVPESIYALADANMISTVIRNFLSNAIKFTPEGGKLTIGGEIEDNSVKVAVIDTGVGMSDDDMKKLFRIDVQHTTIGTGQEKGTGLGLILCKEFVEKNNGDIWVESEVGKGTTFYFTLPVAE